MTWKDITIKQYQELEAISRKEYEHSIDKEIETISCLTGEPIEMLEQLGKGDLMDIARETEFIKEPLAEKLTTRIRIGTRRFNICLEANKLSAQQMILILKYSPTLEAAADNLHYLLACITNEKPWFRSPLPFDHDFENKAKLLQERVSIETVWASTVFFCKVYKSWLETSQDSLKTKARNLLLKAQIEQMKAEKKAPTL